MEQSVEMLSEYSTDSLFIQHNIFVASKYSSSLKEMIKSNPSRFQDKSNPFQILEYGCNDLSGSITIFTQLIEVLRAENPNLPIIIYYNDLPHIKWASSIKTAQSLLDKYSELYMYPVPRNFYDQIINSNSIDFCFSNLALYYLSRIPEDLDNATGCSLFINALDKGHPNVKGWNEIMEEDWSTILARRKAELKEGGRFHVSLDCYRDEPTEDNKKFNEFFGILMKKILLEKCEKYGFRDMEKKLLRPMCCRSREQYYKGLEDKSLGMKIVDWEYFELDIPYFQEYKKGGDKKKYAQSWTLNGKVWSYEQFRGSLVAAGVDEKTALEILDGTYESMARIFEERDDLMAEKETFFVMTIEKELSEIKNEMIGK